MEPRRPDPRLEEIRGQLEKKIAMFITVNRAEIVAQADADRESEVPSVPLFDNYLQGLAQETTRQVGQIGYFNSTAWKLLQRFKDTFYYCVLPDISAEPAKSYAK